jgi:steroid delta-isomerase-like uncharacterized protein
MSERYKTMCRRLREECFSTGSMALADELLGPDFIYRGPSLLPELRGRDAFKQVILGFRTAIPDLKETIIDQIVQGDKVANRFTTGGTHRGELMGLAATGKTFKLTGIDICRIADNKIVEMWVCWDALDFLNSLGAVEQAKKVLTNVQRL